MPLGYYPRPGEILLCHYDRGAVAPEMVKTRPVVVVGPRLRRRAQLVTIVPLSTTEPMPPEAYHSLIELAVSLPPPFGSTRMWAKCDMVQSVALARLDRFREARRQGQPRRWTTGAVSADQLADIRRAILSGLGLDS